MVAQREGRLTSDRLTLHMPLSRASIDSFYPEHAISITISSDSNTLATPDYLKA
jgi:hypothetical protein